MQSAASLNDDRVLKKLVSPVQLREVGDPLAEQHRHEADADLVHQPEVECLPGDVRTGNRHVPLTGDLLVRVIEETSDGKRAIVGHPVGAGHPFHERWIGRPAPSNVGGGSITYIDDTAYPADSGTTAR